MAKKLTEKDYKESRDQLERILQKMELDDFSMDELAELMNQAKVLLEKCKNYLTSKESEIVQWQKKLKEL